MDQSIFKFSDELADAGWMGAAAASILSVFKLGGYGPGVLSSTNRGFVWTQNLGEPSVVKEFPFSIGTLKVEGATISVTFGVQFRDGFPAYIDLMVSFLSDGAAPSIFLEVDPKYAGVADKIIKAPLEDPPTPEERVIGYNIATLQPLRIPFPVGAMEFNFRFDEENDSITSALQFYGAEPNIISGIIDFNLEKVIVIHKLGGLGLYVNKLFIDLSTTGTTTFAGLFPEVYDPTWRGIGAADIVLLYPINAAEKEFIAAGVSGFLMGFDGKFSGSFNFSYTNAKPTATINYVTAELQIRNDEFVRSEVHLGMVLKKATDAFDPNSAPASSTPVTPKQADLQESAKTTYADKKAEMELPGVIDFRVDFIWYNVDGTEVMGCDLVIESFTVNNETHIFSLKGKDAKTGFWVLALAGGTYLQIKQNDKANGFYLMSFAMIELIMAANSPGGAWGPPLKELSLDQVGIRWIRFEGKSYVEFVVGGVVSLDLDHVLGTVLSWMATAFSATLNLSTNLFGETLNSIKIKGELQVELRNLLLFSNVPDDAPEINKLFEQRDFRISAKKLPEFVFNTEQGGSSSIPKPLGGIELVKRALSSGETNFGLAFKLEGLTSSDFKLTTPAVGFVVFIYPEPGFELLPQIVVKPKFTFLIPQALYAEGVIELDKPLPSFEGTMNRIKIDVGAVYEGEKKPEEYVKFTKYKYRMGGELAWGEATYTLIEPHKKFSYTFAEVHIESSAPLFCVGGAGVFGLGLLFGKNIRPGVLNGENNAMGIANWIIGKKAEHPPEDEEEVFKNVMNWPEVPAADGSTWHPSTNYDAADDKLDNIYSIGFTFKLGSPNDNGKTYTANGIAIVGFPEFWIAAGAIVKFKKISTTLTVMIVYDRDSLAIKAIFEVLVDKDGSFLKGNVWLEFGTVWREPKHTWLYIGHWLDAKGGPISLNFLKIFFAKGFVVYDSDGLVEFGIAVIEDDDFARPTINSGAVGLGFALQWGPKRIGPSAVNITLFGIIGVNLALDCDPNLVFGELFIGGYVQLKVLCVKTRLDLMLRLNGLQTDDGHRYAGIFTVRLNMPWPIPDWKYSTDFVIQSADFVPIPDPLVTSSASGLARLEPTSVNLVVDDIVTLPIDAVIALTFDKPIYGMIYGGATDQTSLLLNDDNPDDDKISETTTTEYQSVKYIINYVHVIESIAITRRPTAGGAAVTVAELLASWDAPPAYEGGLPAPDAEAHHTLFLNSLIPANLKFSTEQLGDYNTWVETRNTIYPCSDPGLYCINRLPRPVLNDGELLFDTPYGNVIIKQEGTSYIAYDELVTLGPLGWTSTAPIRLDLAYAMRYDLPYVEQAQFTFVFVNTKPDNGPGKLKDLLSELKIEFSVKLRGKAMQHFNIGIRVDASTPCGWVADKTDLDINGDFLEVSFGNTCTGSSTFTMSIVVRSLHIFYPLDYVQTRGYRVIMAMNQEEGAYAVYQHLATYRLQLDNLCIQSSQSIFQQWQQTTVGSSADPEDAVNDLLDHLLFEPGNDYEVSYLLRSFATIYYEGAQGVKQVQEKEISISTLPVVKFRTENIPTQNVRAYVGFTFPFEGQQAPYASCVTPLLTLRYQGLILKIFEKHFGAGTLIQLMTDVDGNELQPVLQDVLTINSGGDDAALEDLLEHCMPSAVEYVKLSISIWNIALATDTRYGLLLKDTHDNTIPFSISFRTSKHQDFNTHVQYVQDLFETPGNDALINPASFVGDFNTFLDNIELGGIPTYDGAIEKFYLDFLGVESGKLSPLPDQDYVSFIVTSNAGGGMETWAIVIELNEPLLGKEGVWIDTLDPYIPGTDSGIFRTAGGLMLLRDHSGTRIILINRPGGIVSQFSSAISLTMTFSSKLALLEAVEGYVRMTFPDKTTTEQDALVQQQFNELIAMPNISGAMVDVIQVLTIQPPPAL